VSVWQEPVRGGHPDPSLEQLPGIDRLRAQMDAAEGAGGQFPRAPLAHLTGMRLVEVSLGSAAFEMPLTGWLRSPQGAISVGSLAIPADAALALAVISTLPAGASLTTSELSLRVLAPARPGGRVIARGSLVHARRTIALSEATLTDDHGRLLAHGTSLVYILPPGPGLDSPRANGPTAGLSTAAYDTPDPHQRTAAYDTPDPYQRDPEGSVIDQAVWDQMTGLEAIEAIIAGDLPKAPINHLTGIEARAAADGSVTFAMPATRWLCAPPPGRLQGGTVALFAETACSVAVQTTLPAGIALAPVDLKVNYLRPAAADGRELLASGRVMHRGRRTAVATAEVRDAEDRLIALATGSALLLPGRPATL
jgi:uncharacterized protein (TIGR00369 family)